MDLRLARYRPFHSLSEKRFIFYCLFFSAFLCFLLADVYGAESTCYGTTSKGRLEHGVQLPGEGENFVAYSSFAIIIGRTYVHTKVRDIIVDAYEALEKGMPEKVFKYGETGLKEGRRFRPHKTHQNGLSVDFIVPVMDRNGRSVHLPTNVFNKFGYSVEFDETGKYGDFRIDFEALAGHIYALHNAAQEHGVRIKRIIFDPKLQPSLFKTEYGPYVKDNIKFSRKRSWVRHDEHYHVDFDIQCKPM